jgi:hypothetical protein
VWQVARRTSEVNSQADLLKLKKEADNAPFEPLAWGWLPGIDADEIKMSAEGLTTPFTLAWHGDAM